MQSETGTNLQHARHGIRPLMLESDAEPNTVVQVLQKGYLLHDRVLRPALVMVAKPKSEAARAEGGEQNASS